MVTKLIGLAVLGVLTALSTSFATTQLRAFKPVDLPASFSYEMPEYSYDEAGKVSLVASSWVAYRHDGSSVQVRNRVAADGTPMEHRTVTDLEKGHRLAVMSAGKSVRTYPFNEHTLGILRSRSTGCEPRVFAQTSQRLGYRVVLDRKPTAYENFRLEIWRAPELGCVPLETVWIRTLGDGTERIIGRHIAKDLRFGEPDAALFEVPPGYTERSPSSAAIERAKLHPEIDPAIGTELMMRLDEVYWESQIRVTRDVRH